MSNQPGDGRKYKFEKAMSSGRRALKEGRLVRAAFDFREAIQANPSSAVAVACAAYISASQGKMEKAGHWLNRYEDLTEICHAAAHHAGLAYSLVGEPELAVEQIMLSVTLKARSGDTPGARSYRQAAGILSEAGKHA
jgi:Flp pilus assembly protein TadD